MNVNFKDKKIIISAVITLVSGIAVISTATAEGESMGKCYGVNTCKGQSACKTSDSSCAGQNTCKGQGWLKITAADCADKGGRFEAKK